MKVILITGVAQGLGKSLAKLFAKNGYKIGGIDVDKDALNKLEKLLECDKNSYLFVQADISHKKNCIEAVEAIYEYFGQIDILINNAGITYISPFIKSSIQSIEKVIHINLLGAIYTTHAALPYIILQKGTIAFISSVAGFAPLYGRTAYSASKHGLEGFATSLRTELFDKDVNVSIISPSSINTNIRKREIGGHLSRNNEQKRIGHALNPDKVATEIYRSIVKKQRRLLSGKIAIASFWLNKFFPSMYEYVMIRLAKKKVDELS